MMAPELAADAEGPLPSPGGKRITLWAALAGSSSARSRSGPRCVVRPGKRPARNPAAQDLKGNSEGAALATCPARRPPARKRERLKLSRVLFDRPARVTMVEVLRPVEGLPRSLAGG